MNHENDGWGRRDTNSNAAPPGYPPIPSPRNGGQPHPPYSSYGSYTSMSSHHHRQQWRPNEREMYSVGPGHDNERNDDRRPICRFFTKGFCREGKSCRFRHEHIQSSPSAHYGPPNGNISYDSNRMVERTVGYDRHVDDDNRSSNSDVATGFDEFGRQTPAKGGGNKNDGVSKSHNHQIDRSNSNRSTGFNNVGGDDSSHASNSAKPERENHQAGLDADSSSKFWSKIKLNEKPLKKTQQESAGKPHTSSADEPKKTIKWGSNSTQQIRTKNYCKIPGHNHLWKDCPDNKYSKNYKTKSSAPVLTAEESNAMCRAALGNAAATVSTMQNHTNTRLNSAVDNTDTPSAAPPNTSAMSINSLNRPTLTHNTLKQPPTVVASKAASALAKSGSASRVGSIPRRNSAAVQLQRKKSTELQRKSSHACESAASKLKAAGLQLPTPTMYNTHKKTFVPRSQRGLAKRPSPDKPSPTNKKRKMQPNSTPLTPPLAPHRMSCKQGHRRKENIPMAPSGNDAIAITKHTSSRLLAKKNNNPFDAMDGDHHDGNEKDDSSFEDHDGTNVNFESNSANIQLPSKKSSKERAQSDRANSHEVICIDSSEDEGHADEVEVSEQNHDTEEAINAKQAPNNASQSSDKTKQKSVCSNIDTPAKNDLASHNDESSAKELTMDREKVMEIDSLSNTNADTIDEVKEKKDTQNDCTTIFTSITNATKSCDKEVDTSNRDEAQVDKFNSSYHYDHSAIKSSGSTGGRHESFTDEQIDEMECDMLDWVEYSTDILDPQNLSSADDESSMSVGFYCEDSNDDCEANHTTTNASETPTRNSQHELTSRSSSRNSKVLSVDTSLKLSQRSDGSSVTPSPPGDDTCTETDTGLLPPIENLQNNFTKFYTCNKCQRVFNCLKVAADHEIKCAPENAHDRAFDDPVNLCRYMKEFDNSEACHYRPITSRFSAENDTPHMHPAVDSCVADSRAKVKKGNWDSKFEAIKKFQSEHGHLDLHEGFICNDLGNLSKWLRRQKELLRDDKLRTDRKKRIKKLLDEDPSSRNAGNHVCEASKNNAQAEKKTWDKKYNAVRKFLAVHGHLNLPDVDEGSGNLCKWLNTQRKKLSTGKLNGKRATKMKKLLGLDEDIGVMQSVDHLCSTDLSSEFPKQLLVVIDTKTDTLHQFQTEVRQSNIIGSGHGVFLTYLGAKVLRHDAAVRSNRLISEHLDLSVENLVCHPLPAEDIYGKRMTVKIAPQSLFMNENNLLWSKKRSAALDKHLKSSSQVDFEESKVVCKVHKEVEQLRACIPKHERIGQLGINSIHDYTDDDSVLFWSHHQIELGRYGPFRPQDIKPELHLDVKNFLFDYEPNEWAYGMDGEEGKMIDITDDSTGQVHSLARNHTSIYVNEVGHSSDLHENVFIRVNGEASAVYYYISIDEQHAMKKGDTVELLVNYGEAYEDVRNRKGYGLSNIGEGKGPDAEDKAARLRRNFIERKEVEREIVDLTFVQLCFLTEFLTEKVFLPIKEAMHSSLMCPRHIIARRRLHWLRKYVEQRLEVLLQNHPTRLMNPLVVKKLRDSIQKWIFTESNLNPKLLQDAVAHDAQTIRDAIREEISEEIYYEACYQKPNSFLSDPLDESRWCQIAIRLMNYSVHNIAAYTFADSDMRKKLLDKLMTAGRDASYAIKKATSILDGSEVGSKFDAAISSLVFQSRTKQINRSEIVDFLSRNSNSIYNRNRVTIPYSQAAILAEIEAYKDVMELCDMACTNTKSEVIESIDSKQTIISKYDSKGTHSLDASTPQFLWLPRTIDAFRKGFAKVNEEWYLLHQVLLVLHSLASIIDWGTDNEHTFYSLEKLCLAIGADKEKAEAIIASTNAMSSQTNNVRSPIKARKSIGTKPSRTSPRSINSVPKKASRKSNSKTPSAKAGSSLKKTKKKLKSPSHGSPFQLEKGTSLRDRTVRDGPDDNFPGWKVKGIRRISGTHIDNIWYKSEYPDVIVRSQTGVNRIIETMLTKDLDFISACTYLLDNGFKAYFSSTSWKKKYRPHKPPSST